MCSRLIPIHSLPFRGKQILLHFNSKKDAVNQIRSNMLKHK